MSGSLPFISSKFPKPTDTQFWPGRSLSAAWVWCCLQVALWLGRRNWSKLPRNKSSWPARKLTWMPDVIQRWAKLLWPHVSVLGFCRRLFAHFHRLRLASLKFPHLTNSLDLQHKNAIRCYEAMIFNTYWQSSCAVGNLFVPLTKDEVQICYVA